MPRPPSRKLPKAERREQLLGVALDIVRKEGTDALTLGRLAERAGVSKPIAYDHFGTRTSLLMVLYDRFDREQAAGLREALERTPQRLEDVAEVVADALVSCNDAGPEWAAITAALRGDAASTAFLRELVDRCVAFMGEVFAPFAPLAPEELRRRCIGFLGAAESLVCETGYGRVERADAAGSLAAMIIGGLRRD